MKKIFTVMLVLVFAFSAVGCGSSSDTDKDTDSGQTAKPCGVYEMTAVSQTIYDADWNVISTNETEKNENNTWGMYYVFDSSGDMYNAYVSQDELIIYQNENNTGESSYTPVSGMPEYASEDLDYADTSETVQYYLYDEESNTLTFVFRSAHQDELGCSYYASDSRQTYTYTGMNSIDELEANFSE